MTIACLLICNTLHACRYVPERLLHAWATPRYLFLVLISVLSAFVAFFNAFASLPLLFPASILAGFAFGAFWSLMATLTSDIFGLHHFASNYTFIQVILQTTFQHIVSISKPNAGATVRLQQIRQHLSLAFISENLGRSLVCRLGSNLGCSMGCRLACRMP